MGEWRECTLGDLVTFQRGYDLSKSKMKEGKYPVVGSNGIIGYHDEFTTEFPSITIGRSGNVGKPFIFYGRTWSHNTTLYIKDYKGNDPVFVFYFLKTLDLTNYASGSAVPTLNRNHIHILPIRVLSNVETQKKIGNFLKLLDDKIAENKKINDNLEEQVTAVFNNMFSKYDRNSESYKPLSSMAKFKYGTMPKKDKLGVGQYYAFSGYQVVGTYPEVMFENPQLIIVARGVGGCGDIKYTPANCYLTNLSIAIITENKEHDDYLYNYLRLHDTKVMNTGSAQPQITVATLEKFEIPIPSEKELIQFSDFVQPFNVQYRNNLDENKQLSELRDTLLPKLMSGELDVSDIDC